MINYLDFLSTENVKSFIRENVNSDVQKMILNPPKEFKNHIKEISNQILSRQKAKGKLNLWANNFDLIMPPALSIEQASSEATCSYKRKLIKGQHLVDLTGGMGIDCIELSKRFNQTTYVEQQPELCAVFAHNSKVMQQEVEIVNETAESFLEKLSAHPKDTIIYLDPARRDNKKNRVFRIEDCSPNLMEILPKVKEKSSSALVKFSPILDLHAIIEALDGIKEIHVVSVKNDCKEILLLIDFKKRSNLKINAVNLETGQPDYTFNFNEESNSSTQHDFLKKYLYESNSSIMKAGAFKKIAKDFNISKLGENTHLYSSDKLVESFPGRAFEVLSTANKNNIHRFAAKGKINVITRNYPLNANEFKKKWKLKDGGDYFLIAYRDKIGKPQMTICLKVDHLK